MNVFFASLVLPLVTPCLQLRAPAFQPTEYRSRSGTFVLAVEPSDKYGRGPMHARLVNGTAEVWSADVPWTFATASVSDHGAVVAYGDFRTDKQSALRIALFDPRGKLLREHDLKHTNAIVCGPSLPTSNDPILVDERAGVARVRIWTADQSDPRPWKTYALATGEFVCDFVVHCPGSFNETAHAYERSLHVLGDTGLTLCHWYTSDSHPADLAWSKSGATFALVDVKGEPVWSLSLPEDYTDRSSAEASEKLSDRFVWGAPVLACGPGNTFALHLVHDGVRAEYAVEQDASAPRGWSVRETARKPFEAETPRAPTAAAPIALVERDRIQLEVAPGASSPFRNIHRLGFTDAGAPEFIRVEDSGGTTYVRLDARGAVVLEKDLTPLLPKSEFRPRWFDLSGDRWLLAGFHSDPPWIELDVRTGEQKTAPLTGNGFDGYIAPFDDGSYVALVPGSDGAAARTDLYHARGDGTVAGHVGQSSSGPDDTPLEEAVYMSNGVARLTERTFALATMRKLITVDLDARVLRTLALTDVLGHEPGYMDGLLPDRKGGVYFWEHDRLQHVDAAGKLAGSFVPARADGTADPRLARGLAVAPDGRIWTHFHTQLFRLNEAGVADLVLGAEPVEDALNDPDDAVIDARGRSVIRDRVSGAVHVFDADGKHLYVCNVPLAEREKDYAHEWFRVLADGSTWIVTAKGLAHFDAQGQRVGDTTRNEGDSYRDGTSELDAIDPQALATASIDKRPNGKWLTGHCERRIAPDGRRLVLEVEPDDAPFNLLHVYSPKNEPLRSIELPRDATGRTFSVSSRWIVLGSFGQPWTLVRVEDGSVRSFDPEPRDGELRYAGQTPDGKSLLVVCPAKSTLTRYDLP